ncbi:unnamed protein product [Hydatigera taeniaeformis]|uniref:PID domain-containing protein n=1 Tax=Hydatigena taeniaeformis TaxID=6205 RepID=A0A0R3X944_HYDTA|nr:unnamed protein product [Hydatigera taeniaeformis]
MKWGRDSREEEEEEEEEENATIDQLQSATRHCVQHPPPSITRLIALRTVMGEGVQEHGTVVRGSSDRSTRNHTCTAATTEYRGEGVINVGEVVCAVMQCVGVINESVWCTSSRLHRTLSHGHVEVCVCRKESRIPHLVIRMLCNRAEAIASVRSCLREHLEVAEPAHCSSPLRQTARQTRLAVNDLTHISTSHTDSKSGAAAIPFPS